MQENKATLHKVSMTVYERHGYQVAIELLEQATPYLDKHEDQFKEILESLFENIKGNEDE
ncbi:hypothetical protein L4D00_23365 [Photobacterium swingsii]|uniref:hypothetical protein n=1 Tax=Photobacterium swingsii TaxID=680026 RepID=UPI003D0D799E